MCQWRIIFYTLIVHLWNWNARWCNKVFISWDSKQFSISYRKLIPQYQSYIYIQNYKRRPQKGIFMTQVVPIIIIYIRTYSTQQYSLSYPLYNIWSCVSVYPFPLWWLREYTLCLIVIIKSEVWTIIPCLGLSHDKMVCVVCLSIFLQEHGKLKEKCMYKDCAGNR